MFKNNKIKHYIRSSMLFLTTCFMTPAFAVDTPWLARYNGPTNGTDQASYIATDNNGNVYVTGRSDDALNIPDFLTIKYGNAGNQLWAQRADYGTGWDVPSGLIVDTAGNVVVAGLSQSTRNVPHGVLTVKYDTNGQVLWQQHRDDPWGFSTSAIAVDESGNVFVAATTGFQATDPRNEFVFYKYSPAGTLLWERRVSGRVATIVAMKTDPSGNLVVAAIDDAPPGTATSLEDYLTLKLSTDGTLLWTRRYEGEGQFSDRVKGLAIDANGNIYLTGNSHSRATSTTDHIDLDFVTVKYDSAGVFLWDRRFAGTANTDDFSQGIVVDAQANVYVAGYVYTLASDQATWFTEIAVLKYDTHGNTLWEKLYRGPAGSLNGIAADIAIDTAGNTFVTGYSQLPLNTTDYLTVKLDSAGNIVWTQTYNGPGTISDTARRVTTDSRGNAYVTGTSYGGTTTFNDYATIKYVDGVPFPQPTPPPPAPPQAQQVNVSTISVAQGKIVSGGTTNLQSSDNSYLTLQPSRRTSPAQVVFDGISPVATPSKLTFGMEASVTQPNITQTIDLFNFVTNAYEQVNQGIASTSDVQYGRVLSGDLKRFIKPGSNTLRARVTFVPPTRVSTWSARIDQFNWFVTP